MKIKEIIELAALFTESETVSASGVFGANPSAEEIAALSQGNPDFILLLKCANIVLREIAARYYPLITAEQVTVSGEKLLYSALSKAVVTPISLYSGDNKVEFKRLNDGIAAENGSYTLIYKYLPNEKAFSDDAEIEPHITATAVSYGTAAEFFTVKAQNERAALWSKRYAEALRSDGQAKRFGKMPKRSWL